MRTHLYERVNMFGGGFGAVESQERDCKLYHRQYSIKHMRICWRTDEKLNKERSKIIINLTLINSCFFYLLLLLLGRRLLFQFELYILTIIFLFIFHGLFGCCMNNLKRKIKEMSGQKVILSQSTMDCEDLPYFVWRLCSDINRNKVGNEQAVIKWTFETIELLIFY